MTATSTPGASFVASWRVALADRWSRTQPRRDARARDRFCVVGRGCFLHRRESLMVALNRAVVYGLGRGFLDANLMPACARSRTSGIARLDTACSISSACDGRCDDLRRRLAQDVQVDLARIFEFSAAVCLSWVAAFRRESAPFFRCVR